MARKRNRRSNDKQQTTACERHVSEKIEVQLDVDQSKYDACNELVLSIEKHEKKVAVKPVCKPQKLSNKKRKKLQKVLERKAKIKDRKGIIEELKKYSISKEEEYKLMSLKEQQHKRTKRSLDDEVNVNESNSKKVSFKVKKQSDTSVVHQNDLNVVGFIGNSDDDLTDNEPLQVEASNRSKDGDSQRSENNKYSKKEEFVLPSTFSENKKDVRATEVDIGSGKTEFVAIHRLQDVQRARLLLPILSEEQVIMEAIRYNEVVILCGETGSGKTTQVPQFLFEAGYAKTLKICITEPRRVAAISMSKRVAYEMNATNDLVSYQIRFDGNVSSETKICFVTDGVLMREIQQDFLLSSYSVIIIDEAHERSVHSDILIGLISRILPLRLKRGNPLRLIIMSATLRVEDFTGNSRLFKVEPKVLKVQSRQYSVTIHFSKRTPDDYIQEAYLKVCAIHRKYGEGGILVFVTGQHEVQELCVKLRRTFPFGKNSVVYSTSLDATEQSATFGRKKKVKQKNKVLNDLLPDVNLDDYKCISDEEEDIVYNENIDTETGEPEICKNNFQSLYCLPLYAKLPENSQSLIFEKPPENSRLCVIATNIAETSITIPGIKYIVDTGKVKTKVYDKLTGISTMIVSWTSKASADQRAGRAGRVSNGHCFRLYSSAVFKEKFSQFSPPEISDKPVDELLLQMKSMNIENVFNFPFPTPPAKEALIAGEKRLLLLGALKETCTANKNLSQLTYTKITELGKAMSFFPLNPRYAKMLALSVNQGLLVYTIALVASLTVQDIFLDCNISGNAEEQTNERRKKWKSLRRKWADTGSSLLLGDFMILLKAVGTSQFVKCSPKLIEEYGLRLKAMVEIRKLRLQLSSILNKIVANCDLSMNLDMAPPTEMQAKCLRQLLLAGLLDHVAKKLCADEVSDDQRQSIKNGYKSIETENIIYMPSDCALIDVQPEFVVYQEIYESCGKLYMRNVVAIENQWLPLYASSLCKFSKPLEIPEPRYDSSTDRVLCSVTATFGPFCWSVPATEIEYPESVEKYRWFAKHLLQGDVFPFFAEYKHCLVSSPSVVVKSWAKLQPRTQSILSALYSKKCATRSQFIRAVKNDSSFLLNEFCEWLPEEHCTQVRQLWSLSLFETVV